MKRIIRIFIVASCALGSLVHGEDRQPFRTDDGFLNIRALQDIERAKTNKESLPENEWPEGNWGTPERGLRLSLTLAKTNYSTGEPIHATLLLRSITNEPVVYRATFIAGKMTPFGFEVTAPDGQALRTKLDVIDVISVKNLTVLPVTQHKYQERIDALFNIATNGTFQLKAGLKIACPDCVVLESGTVSIEIKSR